MRKTEKQARTDQASPSLSSLAFDSSRVSGPFDNYSFRDNDNKKNGNSPEGNAVFEDLDSSRFSDESEFFRVTPKFSQVIFSLTLTTSYRKLSTSKKNLFFYSNLGR